MELFLKSFFLKCFLVLPVERRAELYCRRKSTRPVIYLRKRFVFLKKKLCPPVNVVFQNIHKRDRKGLHCTGKRHLSLEEGVGHINPGMMPPGP